jgi:hypothetical protein
MLVIAGLILTEVVAVLWGVRRMTPDFALA